MTLNETRRIARWVREHAMRIWLVLLGIFFVAFVVRSWAEIVEMGHELRNASPAWLMIGVVLQLLILSLAGFKYQALLVRLGHRVRFFSLLHAHLLRKVVATIAPVGGPPSVYMLVRYLGRHGVSANASLYTTLLYSVLSYASFIFVMIPIFVLIMVERQLTMLLLTGTLILLVIFGLIIAFVVSVLGGTELPFGLANRLPAKARTFIQESREHDIRPYDLSQALLLAVAARVAAIFMLWTAMEAVGLSLSLPAVLIGYGVGTLFILIAPVLHGIGFVEVSMTVALQQFGAPIDQALAATLLFRLFDLWLPLLLGLVVQLIASPLSLRESTAPLTDEEVAVLLELGQVRMGGPQAPPVWINPAGTGIGPENTGIDGPRFPS